jgi:hypothetical protein
LVFDCTERLSPDRQLVDRIIVKRLIAEHRSQGAMQLLVTICPGMGTAARAATSRRVRPMYFLTNS